MSYKKLFTPGQPFQFSRSKVDLFIECPKCFYLDRVKGISRPEGFPFSLNNAVDKLLKREFDEYRIQQQPHPLLQSKGLNIIPFQHPMIDEWRENFKGIKADFTGHVFSGAVDDIWCDANGDLIIVDYKATARELPVVALSEGGFHDGYRRQIEFYQWLLIQNGFNVSKTGYFVYTTGDNTLNKFNDELKFRTHLIAYEGNHEWIEPTLHSLISCVSSGNIPLSKPGCSYCDFVENRKNY